MNSEIVASERTGTYASLKESLISINMLRAQGCSLTAMIANNDPACLKGSLSYLSHTQHTYHNPLRSASKCALNHSIILLSINERLNPFLSLKHLNSSDTSQYSYTTSQY